MRFPEIYAEIVSELAAIGNARLGLAIQQDRKSCLSYFGISFPKLRARVKQGFSFTSGTPEEVLQIWDDLWRHSPWGDVLFAALEYYLPIAKKGSGLDLWPVMSEWIQQVDNWCHCDQLSRIYSHLLERDISSVYPSLVAWNGSAELWERRASLVSLVHYSGKNSVFLSPAQVLPLVLNCLLDSRHYVQTAVGWVLREMAMVYPGEIVSFIEEHVREFSTMAFSRSIEKLPKETHTQLLALRK